MMDNRRRTVLIVYARFGGGHDQLVSRLRHALLRSCLCLLGFGAVVVLIGDARIAAFDRAQIRFWQRLESPALTAVMKGFTFIGSGLPATLIAVAARAASTWAFTIRAMCWAPTWRAAAG